jgi:hypothetical protein
VIARQSDFEAVVSNDFQAGLASPLTLGTEKWAGARCMILDLLVHSVVTSFSSIRMDIISNLAVTLEL